MNQEQRERERTTGLRAFFYVLLRDHLTLGQCERLMMDASVAHGKGADFSNEHLRGYCDELIRRVLP